jgi:hypothetical protein
VGNSQLLRYCLFKKIAANFPKNFANMVVSAQCKHYIKLISKKITLSISSAISVTTASMVGPEMVAELEPEAVRLELRLRRFRKVIIECNMNKQNSSTCSIVNGKFFSGSSNTTLSFDRYFDAQLI